MVPMDAEEQVHLVMPEKLCGTTHGDPFSAV